MTSSLINKYRNYLPDIFKQDNIDIVTLGEGDTPLILLNNLTKYLNLEIKLYVKFEGLNPTGSFKDRGMTTAVTAAKSNNKIRSIVCASTGNTSASAAAYAARAGLRSVVLIPQGKIATGKLVQAIIAGSKIIQINDNFDAAMQLVKSFEDQGDILIVNSINPYRLEGQKTIAFEVIEQLGNQAPDYHCLPVGNAGNISAHWMGYKDFYQAKIIKHYPKMLGYQAEGASPFIVGHPVKNPETVATAIRIGNPQQWDKALLTSKESQGWFQSVTDQEILTMQKLLAQHEGVFCEPAAATSLAGLYKDYQNTRIKKNSTVVCTLTGNGLKDPDIILNNFDLANNIITIDPVLKDLMHHLH